MTELHRTRELLRLARISQDRWILPLLKQGQLGRTVSKQLLIICLDGDSAPFLGNLLQCLSNLTVKK